MVEGAALVERTVSRWPDGAEAPQGTKLSDFRSVHAYVLLGEPGAGKTTAFKAESGRLVEERKPLGVEGKALGEDIAGGPEPGSASVFVSAGDFIRHDLTRHPEWKGKTLFIDGLDEVRAGPGDPREPLNDLLNRIARLGKPPYRISCREGFWLGESDKHELASVLSGTEPLRLKLDPLDREGVRAILIGEGIEDPDRFIIQALEHGLDGLLWNPQALKLLAKAAGGESWPDGPVATFETACREMTEEVNEEHRAARRDHTSFATDDILLAAGRLSAILLLSGKAGWSRSGPGDEEYPALSEAGSEQDKLRFALDTSLFVNASEGERTPVHRQIAEFLAAKYLSRVIGGGPESRGGLPATRVLALMKGMDGVVMPDLRGLSAWLAAMNRDARSSLIDMDPVGVAFFGDAERFDRHETQRLIAALEARLAHQPEWPSSASVGALMRGPAKAMLWDLLRDRDRSNARQTLVEILLYGVASARTADRAADSAGPLPAEAQETRSPEAKEAEVDEKTLLATVLRDSTWRSNVRQRALTALIHLLKDEPDGPSVLLGLLGGIEEGKVLDEERDDLRGELLACLYPGAIGPEEIWEHLSSNEMPYGKGADFWTKHLVDKSSPEEVRRVLDALRAQAGELLPLLARGRVEAVVFHLLARGLESFGDQMDTAELYDWFHLVEVDLGHGELIPAQCEGISIWSLDTGEAKKGAERIREWLRDRGNVQLALILEGLQRDEAMLKGRLLDLQIGDKFLGDEAPSDFRRWCLSSAIELGEKSPGVSEQLAIWAVVERSHDFGTGRRPLRKGWGPPLTTEEVADAVRGTPSLKEWHERRLEAKDRAAEETAALFESPPYVEARRRREAYVASVREHRKTLARGEGPSRLLHELSDIYFRRSASADPEPDPLQELRIRLGFDEDLADVAISGFRRLVDRKDLPALDDIVGLHEKRKTSLFARPFLAGLAECERTGGAPLERLHDLALRRALGFYLLSGLPTKRHPPEMGLAGLHHPEDARPRWYLDALRTRPEAVADALVAVHRARVGRQGVSRPTSVRLAGEGGIRRRRALGGAEDVRTLSHALHRTAVGGAPAGTLGLPQVLWHGTSWPISSRRGWVVAGWMWPNGPIGSARVCSSPGRRACRSFWSSSPMGAGSRPESTIWSTSWYRVGNPSRTRSGRPADLAALIKAVGAKMGSAWRDFPTDVARFLTASEARLSGWSLF